MNDPIAAADPPQKARPGRRRLLLVAVVVALALAGVAARSVLAGGEVDDVVVATVDGEPILLSQVRSRVTGVAGVHDTQETATSPEWRRLVIQSLVEDIVVEREARRRDLEPTDADVDREFRKVLTQFRDPAAFQDWLVQQRISEDELRRRVRLQLITARVYQAVTEDVKVTTQEVERHYERNRSSFLGMEGTPLPLLEVRDGIKEQLLNRKRDARFQEWLEETRAAVKVEVLVEDWTAEESVEDRTAEESDE